MELNKKQPRIESESKPHHFKKHKKDGMIDIGDLKSQNGKILMSGIRQPEKLEKGQTWEKTGQGPEYQSMEYGSAEFMAYIIAELKDLRRRLKAANIN